MDMFFIPIAIVSAISALLAGILVILGVYPKIMVPLVESGVDNILRLLGGA